MTVMSYTDYRQQVSQTKSQLKDIIADFEKGNNKHHTVMFGAMGELLAEYGVALVGYQKTLMMLDELATLVIQTEMS